MRKVQKSITAVLLSAAQAAGAFALQSPAYAAGTVFSTDTIAAGDNHSLIIHSDKTLWAAGDNSYGQLGVSTVSESFGVEVMRNVIFAEANDNVSFAIDAEGTLYGWGDNSHGQISSKASDYVTTPYKIMNNVVMVSAGESHTIALTVDGTDYGWGSNDYGELGQTSNSIKNGVVELKKNVADIAAGDDFTLLVTKDGALYVCGDNNDGQLGTGNYGSKSTPTAVLQSGVEAAEAGDRHSVILKKKVKNFKKNATFRGFQLFYIMRGKISY